MKAEHRKELETNLLADRMGNLIQKMRGGQRRRWIIIAFSLALSILVIYIVYNIFRGDTQADTQLWIVLDIGDLESMRGPLDNNPMKVAWFQKAHFALWDLGVRMLGSNPTKALDNIEGAGQVYEMLAKQCAGDREWESEALFALAVIEETRAGIDIKNLASAKKKYKEVVDEFYQSEDEAKKSGKKNTMWGALAQRRLKDLEDNSVKLTEFYNKMNTTFKLPEKDKERKIEAQTQQKALKTK